jgi:hypothetical protein
MRSLTVGEWLALLDNAGLALVTAESFSKRHEFDDWTSRSRMTDRDKGTLERMMLEADAHTQLQLAAEIVDDHLAAFTDTKTLFVAQTC